MQHLNVNATTDAIFMSYRLDLPESTGSVVRIEAIYENIEQETGGDSADSMVFRNFILRSDETVIDTYITIDPFGSSHGVDNMRVYRAAWISTSIRKCSVFWERRECKTEVPNKFVAVKVVDSKNPESMLILQEEIRRSMGVEGRHKNLFCVKAHFVDETSGKLCVVMPFPRLCLRTALKETFPRGFPEDLILSALRSVLNALCFLHAQNLLHGDINAGHVYLTRRDKLIYNDDTLENNYEINLGFAATVYDSDDDEEEEMEKKFKDTPYLPMASMSNWAAAPEVYSGTQPYTQKADIWLVGITALELAYGELKLPNRDALEDMIKEIHDKNKIPSNKNYYDDEDDKQQAPNTFKTTFKYYVRKLLPLFSSSSNAVQLCSSSSSSYDEESMLPLLSSNDDDDHNGNEDYCPFSETFMKMVMKCLAWNPEERPSADELLSHKFFRNNMRRMDGEYLYNAVMKRWHSSP